MAASSVVTGPRSTELDTLRGSPASHSSALSATQASRFRPSSASQTDSVPIDRLSIRHLLTLKQRAYEHYALILQRCGITSETRPLSTFILAGINSQTNANASWSSAAKKRQQSKGSTPSSAAQSARTSQNVSQPASPNQTISTPLKGSLSHSSSREEAPGTTEALEPDGVFSAPSFASAALLNSIQRDAEWLNSSKSAANCCTVFEVPLSILQAHFDDALPPCIIHTMLHISAELDKQCPLEAEGRQVQAQVGADVEPNVTAVETTTAAANNSRHSDHSKVVGVFRRAGLRTRIVEIRSLFDSQPTLATFTGGPFTEALLFDYCDVLKQFFRDLPECLLTNPVSHFLLAVANSPEFSQQNGQNEKLRLETLHCAFMLLADANRRALRILFKFLQRVASHEAETNMNLYNLAVCFCPSLFDFTNTGASTLFSGASSGAGGAGNNPTTIGVQWIITMIQHANLLFSIPRQVYESWVSEERLALERLRTAQSAVNTKVGAKEQKQNRPASEWRKLSFFWRSKASRDLEPVASLFVRPITYKRGDAMRFEELGSRLLNGRVNYMLFIDFACQTLEKASDNDAAQRQHNSRANNKISKQSSTARSSSPAATPANAHPVKLHLNRIWLQYNLPEMVAFDTSGIELCAKRSKMERKKLKEAAAAAGGTASTPPNTASPLSNTSSASSATSGPAHTFDSLEQQALIAYPSISQADRNSTLCDEHSAALWRVRFELPDVPVSRLADALWKASFLHDVFDLELVETIEQLSGDAVVERLRRTGPVDRHIREYSVLRARRAHFSVAVPEALAFVLTSVVEYEAHLSKPAVPRPLRHGSGQLKPKAAGNDAKSDGDQHSFVPPVELIQDAVICDLNILVEPAGSGSHVTLLNREELRGYTHEWYTLVWPVVLARWAVRFREYFTTAA